MEKLRRLHPEKKILLTFFSPSGYEVRKNYEGADIVCYLPLDTPCNARRFVKRAHISEAYLIKYEFWRNYINVLHRRGIPCYSVSAIFRPDQIFFRPYGRSYARVLKNLTHLYVQNETSRELLSKIGVTAVSVVGDTRFDRVLDIGSGGGALPEEDRVGAGWWVGSIVSSLTATASSPPSIAMPPLPTSAEASASAFTTCRKQRSMACPSSSVPTTASSARHAI